MKKNKYLFVVMLLLGITLISGGLTAIYVNQEQTQQKKELTVVTSFYPMYIAAMNVIGDSEAVSLKNLSEPQTGCLHDYQLTPQDIKLLSKADVFIVNGGGIENFLSDIAKQNPNLVIVNTTKEIHLLEENAHAWMKMDLYKKQIENIAKGLAEVDQANEKRYKENAEAYNKKISSLQKEADDVKKLIPQGERVILFHEAFAYVAEEYGLTTSYVLDLDEERQISAGEVADVMSQIQKNHVSVIFAEELYGKSMGDTVERESEAKVCYLDSLVRGKQEKDSYLKGMKNNIEKIKEAFSE